MAVYFLVSEEPPIFVGGLTKVKAGFVSINKREHKLCTVL